MAAGWRGRRRRDREVFQWPQTQCDQEIVKYFLPRLVTYVTTNLDSNDPDLVQVQSGVCAVLVGFVGTLVGER